MNLIRIETGFIIELELDTPKSTASNVRTDGRLWLSRKYSMSSSPSNTNTIISFLVAPVDEWDKEASAKSWIAVTELSM